MLEIVDEPLEPGRIVAFRWRLERPVGEGGMGVVWAAREIATDRAVALKFLRKERDPDPKSRMRFVREARAAMAVSHPHVAKVHEVLETETGQPFLVMDLLEGESLRALLRRKRRLDAAECARVFIPAASAVEAAHALGIIHRDLKPENVFLVGGHDVRVLDFGIAKQLPRGDETASASLTSTGALLGTPHYMAPEQVFGDDDLDTRADVWALGVMLYECLSGSRPFDGIGLGPILKRITVEPVRPLHDAQSDVPLAICSLVDRMLSRARENRPPLSEVRDTLARATAPAPPADLPTRMEARLPRAMAPVAPVLPPSTTMGVASRRPLDTPPPTTSRRGTTIGIAASAFVVVAAGMTLTAVRLSRHANTVVVPSPSPTPTASSSSANDDDDASLAASASADPNADASNVALAASGTGGVVKGGGTSGASDHLALARAAFAKGDGATCVRELDEADRSEPNAAARSTSPPGNLAATRARCMMLAGDCDGGRALYRATRVARDKGATELTIDVMTDEMVAQTCTGPLVTPRDQLLRASTRLHESAQGKRKASAKECLDWYATITRLAGTVPPRGSEDHIGRVRDDIVKAAPTCLARAGDCPGSYRVFRDEIVRARRPAPSEPDIRDEYAVLASQMHLCEGTP